MANPPTRSGEEPKTGSFSARLLLSIVEMGGYPNFAPLYQELGYRVQVCTSVRKALNILKKESPAVIVAEFNFQSDFRDRTSNLESLLARLQRMPDTRIIVFYEKEHTTALERMLATYAVDCALPFPVQPERLREGLVSC